MKIIFLADFRTDTQHMSSPVQSDDTSKSEKKPGKNEIIFL